MNVLAIGGWPYVLLDRPGYAFFVIAWGLLLEYPFVRFASGFGFRRAAVATVILNAASAALGVLCVIGAVSWLSFPAGDLAWAAMMHRATEGLEGVIPEETIKASLIQVAANVLVETIVLVRGFRAGRWGSCAIWLAIANVLSALGVAVLAAALQDLERVL